MKVASFDIFDTLISRRVASPADVFRLAFRKYRKTSITQVSEDIFWRERIRAEADLLTASEECTLSEIYELLENRGICEAKAGANAEIEAELQVTIPCAEGISALSAVQNSVDLICLISDTYLPKTTVMDLLSKSEIRIDRDLVFLSSEHGSTKRHGTLFGVVERKLGLPASAFEHCGDNYNSDYVGASQAGWRARLQEAKSKDEQLYLTRALVDEWGGHLPPLERAFIICGGDGAVESGEIASIDPFVREFLLPASIFWAKWVLNEAHRRGVESLVFLGRDAIYPGIVAKSLIGRSNLKISAAIVNVSRRTVLPASVSALTGPELTWTVRSWDKDPLQSLAMRLGVPRIANDPQVSRFFSGLGSKMSLDKSFFDGLADVLKAAGYKDDILKFSETKRQELFGYLKKEVDIFSGRVGIVDLGWFATMQSAFNRLSNDHQIEGFYVSTDADRDAFNKTGWISEMLPGLTSSHVITQRRTVLERIFGLVGSGSVVGYSFNNAPVFEEIPEREIHLGRSIMAEFNAALAKDIAVWDEIFVDSESSAELFHRLVSRFVRSPNLNLVSALQDVTVKVDHDGKNAEKPLISRARFLEHSGAKLRVKAGVAKVWPEASALFDTSPVHFEKWVWSKVASAKRFIVASTRG